MPPTGRTSASLPADVRRQAFDYLSGSTIRGIPRIIRARTLTSRISWTLVVLLFTSIGLWQTVDVLKRFFERSVSHQESNIEDASAPFPSVTLCNLQPLNSAPRTRGVLEEYQRRWTRMQADADEDTARLVSPLLSMSGFFQNSPRAVIRNVSHSARSLLRGCTFSTLGAQWGQSQSCRGLTTPFPHPEYFNCYTVALPRNVTVKRLQLTLYLDDFLYPVFHRDFSAAGMRNGIRLVVHGPASYPEIDAAGIDLAPGTFTSLRVATKNYSLLEPPYGNCSSDVDGTIITAGDPDRGPEPLRYRYEASTCNRMRIQNSVVGDCQCLDPDLPLPINYSVDDGNFEVRKKRDVFSSAMYIVLPYCLKWKDFPDQTEALNIFYNRWRCRHFNTIKMRRQVSRNSSSCPPACHRTEFSIFDTVSSSRWPHESFFRVIYEKYIEPDPVLRQHFRGLKRILQKVADNRTSAYELLQSYHLVNRNFLRVELFRADNNVVMVKAIKVFPFSQLISSLGGTLNLWAGITMIALVEFCELFIILMKTVCDSSEGTEEIAEATDTQEEVDEGEIEERCGEKSQLLDQIFIPKN